MHILHASSGVGGLCITLALTGCVASNPVYHVSEEIPRTIRGASFYLPQTRLAIGFVEQSLTYVKGRHTAVVERCETKPASEPAELCQRFERLGIASLRPGFKAPKARCPADGKTEKRVSFKSFTLMSSSIPDPSQAYIVDLGRNWFQDFDFSMKMDAYGVVGSAQAKTVERAADDALAFGVGLATRLAGVQGPKPANKMLAMDREKLPSDTQAAWKDLEALEKLVAARSLLTAAVDEDTLSRSAVAIAQLNAEIAQLTNHFTGKRTVEESDPQSVAFIPAGTSQGDDIPFRWFDRCGEEGAKDKLVVRLDDASKFVLPAPSEADAACEPTSKPVDMKRPLFDLQDLNSSEGDERGWPHRIPVHTVASVAVCTSECKTYKPLGEIGIAQYGKVLRLPAKTGGKSSNIAATYSVLGSLTQVDVDQEGQAATPIFTALTAATTQQPKPAEADVLAAEIALIKSRQELCRLIYGVDDERCHGANPPVE